MITVFFSYSHNDEALRNELEKHLALLKRQGVIDTWHDRRIDAGENVHEEIKEYLEKADIILLLVSADFLASDYCYDIEMQRALERHQRGEARVIPVILRPCEWQKAPFGSLLATPADGKPITKFENLDDAFLEITQAIRKAADKLRPRVRPPTPVPNEKSGRRMPVFFWAAIVLLILAGTGLGVWDAFYRQHVEYYANVIKRWGLPEGIGRLTDEQVRHRNISLKFTRRGRWGLVKEVRIVNSWGAYPPAFAYVPSWSLESLNPLYTDSERFNLCRVTFEHDKNDQIKKQIAYNRDDRLIYRLDYTAPDIAAYMMEVGISKSVTPSGVRYIKFVRSDTGLDQEVMGLGDDGKPRAGDKGGYGARRVFNSLGLPVELISLGAEGQLASSKVGVAKTTFTYDYQGNLTRSMRFGSNGQPVLGSDGAAEERLVYDPYGNVKEVTSYGTDGQLVTLKDPGVSGIAFAYDGQGNIIENTYFGPDRQLVRGPLGFAKYTAVWDGNGGVLQSFFSPNGKPTLFAGRAVKIKGRYDERGYLVEAAFFDEHDSPVRTDEGCAKVTMTYDEHGNMINWACFDEGGQSVRATDGSARREIDYDGGNISEIRYFGTNGLLGLYEENYAITKRKHNPQGKDTEEAYFDAAKKLVKNKDGYAKVTYRYDDLQGKLIEVLFFDEKDRPTERKGGYAKIAREYDKRGNKTKEAKFDVQGKPARGEEGYVKAEFAYDDRGYNTETAFLDEHDHPILAKEGFAIEKDKYNDQGQLIESAFFGLNGSSPIVLKKRGWATVRYTYGARGKESQRTFFDPGDRLMRNAYGYATVNFSYDDLGRETKKEFLDGNGAPVFTRVTVDKVEPDSKSHRIGLQAGDLILDYDGQEVADTRVFWELELVKGERPRELSIQRDGKVVSLDVPPGRIKGLETVDKVPSERKKQ